MKPSTLHLTSPLVLALRAVAAASGDFNILSMNVAGLPDILQNNDIPGDKKDNSNTIGERFAEYDYDIIHVQEDFNYHAYIYATDDHPYRTATSGGVPFGSGENTLANFDWVDFTRTTWDQCYIGSGDCLTPKGFTFMRVQIADGVYVDAYNLHTDAGTEDGDETARRANIEQVVDYISTNSVGNAVLVFGDTNSRYTRSEDNIALLTSSSGLTDAWVELVRDGVVPTEETICDNPSSTNYCETVDKIFYRSGALLDLQATYWSYESTKFLQADGSILSDHNPVTANFTWSTPSTLSQSKLFGGASSTWFNDATALASKNNPTVSQLNFRGAERLDQVGVTLEDGTTFSHGGTGGDAGSLTLDGTEYWTIARLCKGDKDGSTRNFQITATTSSGRSLTAGTSTDDCETFTAPDAWQIVGFLGQTGDEVDQLGFIYAPR